MLLFFWCFSNSLISCVLKSLKPLARCSWLLQEIVCRPDRQKLVMTNYLFVYDSCCKLLSFQTHCIAPTRNDPLKTNMVDLRNWSLVATIKALARNTSQDHGSESSPRPLPKRQKLGTSHMLMYQSAATKMHSAILLKGWCLHCCLKCEFHQPTVAAPSKCC